MEKEFEKWWSESGVERRVRARTSLYGEGQIKLLLQEAWAAAWQASRDDYKGKTLMRIYTPPSDAPISLDTLKNFKIPNSFY